MLDYNFPPNIPNSSRRSYPIPPIPVNTGKSFGMRVNGFDPWGSHNPDGSMSTLEMGYDSGEYSDIIFPTIRPSRANYPAKEPYPFDEMISNRDYIEVPRGQGDYISRHYKDRYGAGMPYVEEGGIPVFDYIRNHGTLPPIRQDGTANYYDHVFSKYARGGEATRR